jgi:hypothetical protein
MLNLCKKHYLFIIFSFLIILHSSFNKIGPWDEYHLLYYFKNKLPFPFYDSNFIYYDAYLLGRFSPITGQEFNIPILLGLDINYSFLFVSIIILLTIFVYFHLLDHFYNYYNKRIFILFLIFILSSPSFYILSTRLLYAEDTLAFLIIFFLFIFLKCVNSKDLNNKFFWNILLILSTTLTLLYKENSFIIIIVFVISYFFYDFKKLIKHKFITAYIFSCSIIYLSILIYINLAYKNNDLAYVQNLNWNFLANSLLTLIRYSIFNDPILFFILIPSGLILLKRSRNAFFKSIFISGVVNILFFISLGLYSPYYLYLCYFLLFPLFYEGLLNFLKFSNFKKKLVFFFIICTVFLSFINSIFYYFESRVLSLTFNSTVKYLANNIKNKENVTKIFVCNDLNVGNLAQVYILGEHIKYNDIDTDQFEFYPLRNEARNILNSKLSPFDRNEYHYNNSIFRDEFKKSSPQKGDLLINMYNYSSNRIHSCSLLKDNQYAEVFSSVLSFPNTLISNLIKIFIYKKEFNKDYFIKKIGYSIFEIK